MKVTKTGLEGVLFIEPRVFNDQRGLFFESYSEKKYKENGVASNLVQDNHSVSKKGVLRGMHFQVKSAQAKLVWVAQGEVFDVVVDIRKESPTYKKWIGFPLSAETPAQVYIPEGYAHGFCVLSETATFLYKCSDYYSPENERGLAWNDPEIAIDWPIENPILSEKDMKNPFLRDL
jgi:dTDP-4-dehydrorhamnose 3,5-epimerase